MTRVYSNIACCLCASAGLVSFGDLQYRAAKDVIVDLCCAVLWYLNTVCEHNGLGEAEKDAAPVQAR